MRVHRAVAVAIAFVLVPAGCGGDDGSADDASLEISDPSLVPLSVITAAQGKALLESDASIVLIDVRTPDEFARGHIEGAVNHDVESGAFADALSDLPTGGRYIVYCRTGNRSAEAMRQMVAAGFTDVYDMGGIQAWTANGFPIVTA